MVDYDDTGSIGKRYRREDEIGTPYCITVDFDTVGDEAKGIAADNCVTVRDRDTMEQLKDVKERTEALYRYLDIEGKKIQVEEEQLRTQAPGFWDDQKAAEALLPLSGILR